MERSLHLHHACAGAFQERMRTHPQAHEQRIGKRSNADVTVRFSKAQIMTGLTEVAGIDDRWKPAKYPSHTQHHGVPTAVISLLTTFQAVPRLQTLSLG